MGFDPLLRKKVRKLANSKLDSVKEDEIYQSAEFRQYLNGLNRSLLGSRCRSMEIVVDRGKPDGRIACTNGNRTYLNYKHQIFERFTTPESRFVARMGAFFHEKAHDLYLDFDEKIRALDYIEGGNFYGGIPSDLTPLEKRYLPEVVAALKNEVSRPIFQKMFHKIHNILSDTHDENALMKEFGSYVSESIWLLRDSLHAQFDTFETGLSKVKNNLLPPISFAYNLLLQQSRFGYVLARNHEDYEKTPWYPLMKEIGKHARKAYRSDDTMVQFREIYHIMLLFWPIIRSDIQNLQDMQDLLNTLNKALRISGTNDAQGAVGHSRGGATNKSEDADDEDADDEDADDEDADDEDTDGEDADGEDADDEDADDEDADGEDADGEDADGEDADGGDTAGEDTDDDDADGENNSQTPINADMVKRILEALQKGADGLPEAEEPQNLPSSSAAVQARAKARMSNTEEDASDDNDKDIPQRPEENSSPLYAILPSLKQQVAIGKAEDELESLAKDAMCNVVFAVNQTSPHVGHPLIFKRITSVTAAARALYDEIMSDALSISRRLQKQLLEAMRDLKEGFVTKHRPYGKILCANDAYRPDQRYFANKKLPQDYPDMAIAVLVDHSGSMRGNRISTAMKATMLLHDFAVGINIPIMIAGHYADYGKQVVIRLYTDFEQVGRNDRYRLAEMKVQPEWCNRDGMALNVIGGLLERRPEEVKLLIILSDGRPNDFGYGGNEAAEDIRNIVKGLKKKGIEVIAAGIGEDRDQVQEIYKDEFLDISDLQKLPKTMVNIVKKRVLRNIN